MVDLESQIDIHMDSPYNPHIIRTFPEGMPPGTNLCLLGFRCSKEVAPKVRAKIWTAVVAELEKFWQKTQDAARVSRRKWDLDTNNLLAVKLSATAATAACSGP